MNPFEVMKNAKELKEKTDALNNELANLNVSGSAGGKMVTVTLNGKMQMVDIQLDPICVDNRDIQMLKDLIIAAYNSALDNVTEEINTRSKAALSNIDISKLGL